MKHEYIQKAVDLREDHSPNAYSLESELINDDFAILIDLNASETETDPAELRITEDYYKEKLKQIIPNSNQSLPTDTGNES